MTVSLLRNGIPREERHELGENQQAAESHGSLLAVFSCQDRELARTKLGAGVKNLQGDRQSIRRAEFAFLRLD